MLYRWRRVIFGSVAVVIIAGLLVALNRNPVAWAKSTYYQIRDETVTVQGVTATASPAKSVAAGFEVSGLASPAPAQPWGTAWPANTPAATSCGGAPNIGQVVLTLAQPTRVVGMDILAGLAVDDSDRLRQNRPARVDVMYAEGGCSELTLGDTADSQHVSFDTGSAVSQLILAVATVDAPVPGAGAPQPVVAIRGVTLLKRPG